MKILYSIIIWICVLFLLMIYFTNIMWLSWQSMYLWSQSNRISIAAGLALIMLVSMILGASVVLLLKSLVHTRPKDFDEFDDDF